MPYLTECRLVKRESDSLVEYQRLSPKICADRDYTLRVWNKFVACLWWSGLFQSMGAGESTRSSGKERRYPDKSVRRWLLEPDGTNKTRATYSVYTDTYAAPFRRSWPTALVRSASGGFSKQSANK